MNGVCESIVVTELKVKISTQIQFIFCFLNILLALSLSNGMTRHFLSQVQYDWKSISGLSQINYISP